MTSLKSLAEGNDHMVPSIAETYGGQAGDFKNLRPTPGKPGDFSATIKRTHATALWRDAAYGAATRGQLLAHGYNCEVRIHYEAARIAVLAGLES